MDDSYLSWLRLSQAYVIMGYHDKSCDVLVTASELYPEKWEVWRDLSILSGHCKNFNKMIVSYHKLLDLKKSYTDIHLLLKLAKQVELKSGSVDYDLRKDALDLFTRIVNRDPQNPLLWALFALVVASAEKMSEDVVSVAVKYLKKSVALSTQNRFWYKKFTTTQQVLHSSQIIADVFISSCHIFKQMKESKDLSQIIITFLKEIIAKVKEHYTDLIGNILKAEYRPSIEKLEEKLKYLENMS